MSPKVKHPEEGAVMDRVLRFPEVKRLTGLSRTTIWEQEKAGKFPRHIQISARAVGWCESHVTAWLDALANGPAEEPARRPNLR
jgi:prophage regulatory protein